MRYIHARHDFDIKLEYYFHKVWLYNFFVKETNSVILRYKP